MTTRRSFIKTLAAIPPALTFRHGWAANPAPDPSRLALIIGNSAYRDAPLTNPANDAKAMAGLFTQAGFTVDSRLDATRTDMLAAIERFGTAVKRSDARLVVFYYAGHGAQLDWRNYLLPVDAVVEKQEHMKQRCVDLSLLLGQFSAAKDKTFIVILDACRNNPFGTSYRPEQKGLSQFDAPVGSLLAYATSPGNVASDGEGANGLYTENLVRELSQRGTRIEDALKRVRLNVRLASHGAQIPWETTSLEGDVFIFSEGHKKLSEGELEQLVEAEVTEWARIRSSKQIDDWVSYLRSFPNGRFAEIAQMRLTRLLAEVEKLATEERQREEQRKLEAQQRLDQERAERERIRAAEEQRLVAERKQAEELQLAQRRRQEEKLSLEARRRQEQERLDRQRLAEAESLAQERKQQDEQRQAAEQKRLEQHKLAQLAAAKPAPDQAPAPSPATASVPAPAATPAAIPARKPAPTSAAALAPTTAMIDIRPDVPVPMLIAPSVNPFSAGRYPLGRIYTVGDSATTRQTDLLTGIEENTRTAHVTRVDYDEDRVEYNRGAIITDLMGNFIKQGPNEYDTPVQFSPAEFQVGKRWTAAFHKIRNGADSNVSLDMQIVKRETISVPAGTFDTFRIEGQGWNVTRGKRRQVKFWMVPGLNFAVRSESVTHDRKGRFAETTRRELVALRQHTFSL